MTPISDRQTDRQTDTQTHKHTNTHTHTHAPSYRGRLTVINIAQLLSLEDIGYVILV